MSLVFGGGDKIATCDDCGESILEGKLFMIDAWSQTICVECRKKTPYAKHDKAMPAPIPEGEPAFADFGFCEYTSPSEVLSSWGSKKQEVQKSRASDYNWEPVMLSKPMSLPCHLCERGCSKSEYVDMHSFAVEGVGFVSVPCPTSKEDFAKIEGPHFSIENSVKKDRPDG